jgi:hypothetical protein
MRLLAVAILQQLARKLGSLVANPAEVLAGGYCVKLGALSSPRATGLGAGRPVGLRDTARNLSNQCPRCKKGDIS